VRIVSSARAPRTTCGTTAGITAPSLVIGGRYDGQADPANSERMASRIPNARLVLCEGGHVFFLQDPTALPTIVAFLDEK
jgi:3-oxoadipate enol-lactonase